MNRFRNTPAGFARRRGLTLIELLIAMSIMAMVVGSLGALAHGVQLAFEYTEGLGLATQHARVVLDRITRHIEGATANEHFPGFLVVPESEGKWEFPETLVVWYPDSPGDTGAPKRKPQYNELLIYTPNPVRANELLEIRPSGTGEVPDIDHMDQWRSAVSRIRSGWVEKASVLTHLLRVCRMSESDRNTRSRGAVRFKAEKRKIGCPENGLLEASLRIELQLMPGDAPAVANKNTHKAVPFFGMATSVYWLNE